ncbi:MAG TPA: hypothetical protein VH637_23795 [Streptosporangiaceae bacterium]|jgi:hypothetical protein
MTTGPGANGEAMTLDRAAAGLLAPGRPAAWSRLTRDPRKWQLYSQEPGFMVAHAGLLAELGPGVIDWLAGHALLLVKPEGWIDGVLPRVLRFLAGRGFEVAAVFRAGLTPVAIHDIWRYSWNIGPVERIELSELLLALGPAYGLILADRERAAGQWATTRLAQMKGPSRPDQQRPGQLRHELGSPCRVMSYVHIPDEPADIVRDLSLLLDRPEMTALIGRSMAGPDIPAAVSPADFSDVSCLDHSGSYQPGPEYRTASVRQRIAFMKDAFERRREGCRYRIPPALWQHLLELSAAISELPTTGTKLIEPLAESSS